MSEKDRVERDSFFDEDEEDESIEDKYLTFMLNAEEYGLEIKYVTEIIRSQKITEVPDMPSFVKGVINLRGKVIPVMDLHLRFSIKETTYDDFTCVVVIRVDDQAVGLLVDRVSEVLNIPKKEIEPPPQVRKGESSRFVKGMGKAGDKVKILLDAHKLLFEELIDAAGKEAPTIEKN